MASRTISRRGKLIRPGILLLVTGHLGYRGHQDIFLAAAVEGIHLASLIHDDIIDRSTYRRGEKTALQKFGPDFSLLLGDFFFIRSIARSLSMKETEIPEMLAEAARMMIEGEIEELAESYNFNIGRRRYLKIIEKKTASLFQVTCQLACRLGRAGSAEAEALEEYGLNLGLAFQVIDDLLDLVGQPAQTGKPLFSDLKEGRVTLPLILALKKSDQAEHRKLTALLEAAKKKREEGVWPALSALIQNTGAIQETFRQAASFTARARSAAGRLSPSIYRQSLLQLTDFVLWREQ
ncbi:MAG: polyprenyl synthetase family protein [Candidatus Saccharicenans sp.]|nr:polyprenyl synthetase family protein [Candidatus Saccharicenans sp.]